MSEKNGKKRKKTENGRKKGLDKLAGACYNTYARGLHPGAWAFRR